MLRCLHDEGRIQHHCSADRERQSYVPRVILAPVLLPVARHSEGCEFPLHIEKYRGIIDLAGQWIAWAVLFFFYALVEVVMRRIQEKTQTEEKVRASGEPQADRMRELADSEARRLRCEIERRFTSTGKLDVPPEWKRRRKIAWAMDPLGDFGYLIWRDCGQNLSVGCDVGERAS
jgi:hypothetical protein